MANGREYAEKLVGPLDRSFYTSQRDVAQKTYDTNWEDLQNQYKNLQEKLKRDQAEANRNFANGLVNVAENSYDRMSSATDKMATQGLTSSGLGNLVKQGDITTKGTEVLDLLDKSGDISVKVAEDLSNMNKTVTDKQNELADNLADALGQIGSKDVATQMGYLNGLANLAEAKEARDAENELAKARRAASNSGSGSGGGKDTDDKLSEAFRRFNISDIIFSPDLTDEEKQIMLGALHGYNTETTGYVLPYANNGKNNMSYDYLNNLLYGSGFRTSDVDDIVNAIEDNILANQLTGKSP